MPLDTLPPRPRPRSNAPPRADERADFVAPNGDRFDEAAAQAACDFFPRYLRFTKGVWAGRPFRLEAWQSEDIIRPFFGWKRANGTRRFRRCILFVARKNGKTELGAGVAILGTLGDGEKGAETYCLASTEEQARILFDKASAMVGANRELSADCGITNESIYWSRHDAFIKPLDGKARGKHGLNASCILSDEIHEWRTGDLYVTVHQSEAARVQPIEFDTSTAGARGGNYGWEVWQEALKIVEGTSSDDETLVVIYAADPDDDWTKETTWHKASPNLNVSVGIDYLRAECRKALGNPRLENDFRRYFLNQWTGQAVRWLPMHKWDACAAGAHASKWNDESDIAGKARVVGGLDLSSTNDFTCLAWALLPDGESRITRRLYRYFYPEGRIEERMKQTGLPLDRWAKAGAIILTPGNSVDYAFVAQKLLEDGEKFDIALLGIDRWNCKHFSNTAVERGFPLEKIVQVGQGYRDLSEPSKAYENLVFDGFLDHGGHPVTRWMADNVMIATDPAGNIKPVKNRSSEKIDGIVADIIAQFVALNGDVTEGVGIIF